MQIEFTIGDLASEVRYRGFPHIVMNLDLLRFRNGRLDINPN